MCNCLSYNAGGDLGGGSPERVMFYRKYFPDSERETVCVDECIADMIEKLWTAGVETCACCCGHNGQSKIANGNANVMISDPAQAQLAHEVLSTDNRLWWISIWAGGAT